MRISHGQSAMRINFDEDEYNTLSKPPLGHKPHTDKLKGLYVQLNIKGVKDFLIFSTYKLPNSNLVNFTIGNNKLTFPNLFYLGPWQSFKSIKTLKLFAPEPVIWERQETAEGVLYYINRPPMEAPPNAKQKPRQGARAKLAKLQAQDRAENRSVLPDDRFVGDTGSMGPGRKPLPKVESTPDRALTDAVANTVQLRSAVDVINRNKEQYGDELLLEITAAGKLRFLWSYGG